MFKYINPTKISSYKIDEILWFPQEKRRRKNRERRKTNVFFSSLYNFSWSYNKVDRDRHIKERKTVFFYFLDAVVVVFFSLLRFSYFDDCQPRRRDPTGSVPHIPQSMMFEILLVILYRFYFLKNTFILNIAAGRMMIIIVPCLYFPPLIFALKPNDLIVGYITTDSNIIMKITTPHNQIC